MGAFFTEGQSLQEQFQALQRKQQQQLEKEQVSSNLRNHQFDVFQQEPRELNQLQRQIPTQQNRKMLLHNIRQQNPGPQQMQLTSNIRPETKEPLFMNNISHDQILNHLRQASQLMAHTSDFMSTRNISYQRRSDDVSLFDGDDDIIRTSDEGNI